MVTFHKPCWHSGQLILEHSVVLGGEFDVETFVARLRLGEFDLNLNAVLRKLSAPQLEKVADLLMTKHSAKTAPIK